MKESRRPVAADFRLTGDSQVADLSARGLTALPEAPDQFEELRELYIDNNDIDALPPWIGDLTGLATLSCSANELSSMPASITNLAELRHLSCRGNRLSDLPGGIAGLVNLRELDLSGNRFAELPPEIGQLAGLQVLRLSANQLSDLPGGIAGLVNLRELDLSGNRFAELPPEIGQLAGLQELLVGKNRIKSLPRELAPLLTSGLLLRIAENPLQEPLPELLQRGSVDAGVYLSSLAMAEPQYDAKLIVVGDGNVGKTSLVAALRGEQFVADRPTTHGIEIQQIHLSHPSQDVDLTVRAWDFGGQEVYRITQQFYFSRRAVYLVVWNSRVGAEGSDIESWIRRIRLRVGKESIVLLVATHSSERLPEIDYTGLLRAFPNIISGQYSVDTMTGMGMGELQQAIVSSAASLPQMGQLLSPAWVAARDAVLARSRFQPHIDYSQFSDICARYGLGGSEANALANLLHDIGQVVYYTEDEGLRDLVILNPEWVTRAIARILESYRVRETGGVLDHSDLSDIWPHELGYSSGDYRYFLRLMEKFDVSFRLPDDTGRSLVAQLVPYTRPDLPWDFASPIPNGIRTLRLLCYLSDPAPGLVAWLTVRHHGASTGTHWRRGVFLRHPIAAYRSEALLELRDANTLELEVRAPSPDLFFSELRDSIEDLISRRWPGIEYDLRVPCPTVSAGSACGGQFKLQALLSLRERGEEEVLCMECLERHSISTLVSGLAPGRNLAFALQDLDDRLTGTERSVRALEVNAAETADVLRRMLISISTEIIDSPHLFTLVPGESENRGLFRFRNTRYRMTLWCEHPGSWHQWPEASYELRLPTEWLDQVRAYAQLMVRMLRIVTPLRDLTNTPSLRSLSYGEQDVLERMNSMLTESADAERQHAKLNVALDGLTPDEASGLRALRSLLFQLDANRIFGGLRRVQSPSSDFLWVCPVHYLLYDPGLPNVT